MTDFYDTPPHSIGAGEVQLIWRGKITLLASLYRVSNKIAILCILSCVVSGSAMFNLASNEFFHPFRLYV